ncbi:PD-(D/E)XK nuclease family protein [Arthrobacter sp. zg-Y1110]|uniref:PD-(D/E)XK nuclease family protein n=1 Tax=Arthrobacter sp. zg-Y1110 TaxID=2886932 RepID=UPI001D136D7A|nr:PD-(D/E)XK nuclease family protein [Arthrobacter sp. zg-Y1110]MCC3291771.1 PD-(D/E)XK nuclease family protein [Arthrobacter sp. zg-Y1110]UWX85606.1 PD-(D/E)XK nuclease family protein [Arthrobacter sp. zg-Y1110]
MSTHSLSTSAALEEHSSTQTYTSTPEALQALAEAVTKAQQGKPLQPVTVLAPSRVAAQDLSHYLGRILNDGRGSAAVRTTTLADLAEELAATDGQLACRAPLPAMVREGAVTAVLADTPGLFTEVADQPATARAIAATSASLDAACPDDLTGLSPLVCEVARVHRAAAGILGDSWYTSLDLYSAAAAALQTPRIGKLLGPVIGFQLADEQDPSAAAFRAALEQQAGTTYLTAMCSPAPGEQILSASDADDEARAVVRLVIEKLRTGTSGHRIGVFYSAAEPYRALLAQRFDEAGISFAGPSALALADTGLARGLANLLHLDPANPDVRVILDVMSQGVLHWREENLPSSAVCERLHASPPAEQEEADETREPTEAEQKRQQAYAQFTGFVGVLGERLAEVFTARTWTEAAGTLAEFVTEFLGPRSETERPELAKAREALEEVLRDLGLLHGIAPAPSAAAVHAAVAQGIDARRFSTGSSGTGVVLGSYDDGVGRDLDVVFITGAADGLAPARIRENPLLPDSAGHLLAVKLPTIHERSSARREQFRQLLATGTDRTILFPRGNLRAGGTLQASRWLGGTTVTDLPSFAHGLMHGSPTGVAATGQEWRVRRLLSTGSLTGDAVLANVSEVRTDRRNGTFSRFNGNLTGVSGPIIDPQRAISPTNLEDWVISPLAYFLHRVLRAELFEDVTLEVQISNLQRGNLMHKVLEDYVRGLTDGSQTVSSERLLEIAEAAFESTINPAWLLHTWDRDKSRIRTDLQKVHDSDQQARENGWQHLSVEAEFGAEDGEPSVELDLPNGSIVRFRGKVDRVDRHSSGQVLVIDYKTGKADKYKKLTREDPTAGGTRFQLPVYGLFARRFSTDPGAEVRAEYRFITADGKYERVGYEVGADVETRLREDAGLVMAALQAGIFPPRPESDRYTNHTTLMGAAGVRHTWERLKDDPALSDYSRFFQEEK